MKKIVIYDGECGLCQWSVDLIRNIDKKKQYDFLAYQSADAPELLKDKGINDFRGDEVAVIVGKKFITGANAIEYILLSASGFWYGLGLVTSIFPQKLKQKVYLFIAKNRKKNVSCSL